jgi:hypothetical protein
MIELGDKTEFSSTDPLSEEFRKAQEQDNLESDAASPPVQSPPEPQSNQIKMASLQQTYQECREEAKSILQCILAILQKYLKSPDPNAEEATKEASSLYERSNKYNVAWRELICGHGDKEILEPGYGGGGEIQTEITKLNRALRAILETNHNLPSNLSDECCKAFCAVTMEPLLSVHPTLGQICDEDNIVFWFYMVSPWPCWHDAGTEIEVPGRL